LKKEIFIPTVFNLSCLTDWWLNYLSAKLRHLKL